MLCEDIFIITCDLCGEEIHIHSDDPIEKDGLVICKKCQKDAIHTR